MCRPVRLIAVLLVLAALGGCASSPGPTSRDGGAAAEGGSTADLRDKAQAKAKRLTKRAKYAAAAAALESAGLDSEADRVRQRGERALYRSAKRAVAAGRYKTAKRLASQARKLRKTARSAAVIATANAQIAKAEAAARERRRLALKPPEQEAADDCHPSYSGACLKPDSSDYDCAGGSGDGPDYTGPVQVVGDDPYDLDRDGNGSGCESS